MLVFFQESPLILLHPLHTNTIRGTKSGSKVFLKKTTDINIKQFETINLRFLQDTAA